MTHATPGPWKVGYSDDFEGQQVIMEQDCNGRVLALIDDTDEQDQANARLIAAAPELLEACKKLLPCLQNWMEIAEDEDYREYDNKALEVGILAIAHAEAKEPIP